MVHPFMGSETCALLCVYDGHGEHGDVVRRVVFILAGAPEGSNPEPKSDFSNEAGAGKHVVIREKPASLGHTSTNTRCAFSQNVFS